MSFTVVFDVLQERIKEMPVLFRNRGSERFNRGEMGGKGFGGGHKNIKITHKNNEISIPWIDLSLTRK